MNSREKILSLVGPSRVDVNPLPDFKESVVTWDNRLAKFTEVLTSIGGAVIEVQSYSGIREFLYQQFGQGQRIVSFIPIDNAGDAAPSQLHPLDNVEVSLIRGKFGVAENGSVWVTDDHLPDRVLPFVCQHLVVVLNKYDLVNTRGSCFSEKRKKRKTKRCDTG